jgi:hypothetical protein
MPEDGTDSIFRRWYPTDLIKCAIQFQAFVATPDRLVATAGTMSSTVTTKFPQLMLDENGIRPIFMPMNETGYFDRLNR